MKYRIIALAVLLAIFVIGLLLDVTKTPASSSGVQPAPSREDDTMKNLKL